MELKIERVEIPVDGGSMGGYLARPDDANERPAVLVFMEIFGINSHIREVTERIAREGYVALAVDYFHRTGPGVELSYDDAGFTEGFALLNQLKADEMIADARAAIVYLQGRDDADGDRVGAIGFCIGGHMTYLVACETGVRAAASFYGGGVAGAEGMGGAPSTLGRTSKISGKILCLWGDKDEYIPSDQVEAIRAALKEAGTRHDTVLYSGVEHGFFCDQRDSFDEKSANDAWERVKTLFAEELA